MKKHIILITTLVFFPLLIFAQTNKNLIKKADSLFSAGNYIEASNIYKKLTKTHAHNPLFFNKLAKCFVKANKIDSAKIILNKSIKNNVSDAESYANLASIYITTQQMDSALTYIQTAKILNPDSDKYDVIEGSIFLLDNNIDTAFFLFNQALKKNPKNAKALYFKAYIYSVNNSLDSALKYVSRALKYGNLPTFHKLRADILYKQQRYTDALFEIDKAIKLDSNITYIIAKAKIHSTLEQYRDVLNLVLPEIKKAYNQDLVYYAVISYYNLNMNDSAFYYISYAHKEDKNNDLFYYLEGYIYYMSKNYENAYLNFKAAIDLNPEEPDYFYLYCESKILMNTDTNIFDINRKFIDFNQENMRKMEKLTKSKKSKYYFPKLLAQFNTNPTSLSLDEYFMFYFGNSFRKGFSGYSNSDPQIATDFEDKKYNECIKLSKDFLSSHPTSIVSYYYLANSYYSLKKYTLAMKYLTPYYGFIYSILATGDGMSKDNPFIITSIVDEYSILQFYNVTFAGQKLLTDKRHNYDVVDYIENKKKNSIYFNIDSFYGKH